MRIGNTQEARRNFETAGNLMMRFAAQIPIVKNPRSAIWAYRQASSYYYDGERYERAEEALKKSNEISTIIGIDIDIDTDTETSAREKEKSDKDKVADTNRREYFELPEVIEIWRKLSKIQDER